MFNNFPLNESEWNDEVGPLADAVADDELSIVRALLNSGANPNIVAQDGMAPLELAVKNGNYEMVELLVNHGARAEPKQLSFFEQETSEPSIDFFAVIDETEDDEMLGIFPSYGDAYIWCIRLVPSEMIQSLRREGFGSRKEIIEYSIESGNYIRPIQNVNQLLGETSTPGQKILKMLIKSKVSEEIKEKYYPQLQRISKVKTIFNK